MMNIEGNSNVNKPTLKYWEKYDGIFPNDDITNLIDTIKKRIEREMNEIGTFQEISETFFNKKPGIYVGDVSLNLKPVSNLNSNKEAILYTDIKNEDGSYHTERELMQGTKKEILDFINAETFNHDFKAVMINCSESFEKSGLV